MAIVGLQLRSGRDRYVIPGNDDAIRAIRLFAAKIADACIEGRTMYEASLKEDLGEAEIPAWKRGEAEAAASRKQNFRPRKRLSLRQSP